MSLAGGVRLSREDDDIEKDIVAELRADQDHADQCLVEIAVDRGVVRLTGFVDSYARKCAIERAVGRVARVRDVRDHLRVRPPGDEYREDRRIERAAARALEWDARVPEGVRAHVTDGALRLQGAVDRFSQREAAEEAVRNLVGVRDVLDEIKVTPTPSPADLGVHVEAAIRRRCGAGCRDMRIRVAAANGVVTLRGLVPTFTMLEEIELAVRSIPGVRRVDNRLLVA